MLRIEHGFTVNTEQHLNQTMIGKDVGQTLTVKF